MEGVCMHGADGGRALRQLSSPKRSKNLREAGRCAHDTRMRIFVTGASGFVGSAVVPELLRAGHHVVGLARSVASASAVAAAGAEVQWGELADLDGLRRGASSADGVIHLGFIHDFANFAKSAETDRAAIQAMAAALAGSNRPLAAGSLLVVGAQLGQSVVVSRRAIAGDAEKPSCGAHVEVAALHSSPSISA